MTIECKTKEFDTYEEAEDYAARRGGDVLTMPGHIYLAVKDRDCDRIERAGGPANARFAGQEARGGYRTITVGRKAEETGYQKKENRMKKNEVQIGGTYVAKVSGQLARVRIDGASPFGGWDATNVSTHRRVRIKSAQRLRREVSPKKADEPPAAETTVVHEEGDDGPSYDPSRCATKRCKGTPVMTHLKRPLCQACWDRHCSEEQPSDVNEAPSDACRPGEEPETPEQENAMSTKKSTKKQSTKKSTKKSPVASKPKATKERAPKRVSALDAAAYVLEKAGKPMRAQELIAAMADQGLWKSPGGKTPHATLYAAMTREERDKGRVSRFTKVDRGQFKFHKHEKAA